MIFTGFKRKSNQIFFNKKATHLLKNSSEYASTKVNKVIILLDELSNKEKVLKSFSAETGISKEAVQCVVFQKKVSKNNEDKSIISPKDFAWYGKIRSENLKDILTEKYDMLINYGKEDTLYTNLLLLHCKTNFRVGFSYLNNQLYDLLINCNYGEIDLFNKELYKYLKILKKVK